MIYKKLLILDFLSKVPDTIKAKYVYTISHFPESVRHKSDLTHWKTQARLDKWSLLPVEVQKKYSELPLLFKSTITGAKRKGCNLDRFLPMDLQIEFDNMLQSRVMACGQDEDAINELMQTKSMVLGMQSLIARYNARAELANKETLEHNEMLVEKYKAKTITKEELMEQKRNMLRLAHGIPNSTWASRFKMRFGWRQLQLSAPANYVEYDDPRLNLWREAFEVWLFLSFCVCVVVCLCFLIVCAVSFLDCSLFVGCVFREVCECQPFFVGLFVSSFFICFLFRPSKAKPQTRR